ncbi:uncharacterized protein KIAA2012 [Lucilia cuprina]|uniref:uncharacterized protein KIAA2012 n=1 Tax=Lucilia cuprina TaxID=7375 RepID=UPI001F069907|nr:uncharacterized protein KIAA2012 [Lucilia cuprina]XP_046808863.1 uncharacterized protein KIAA2012 [Lucilia cuprina]
MVNETNKPQEALENEQLGQRLDASNQALADMQAEHRQLLEEMEQLRKRAEDLQRLREQQEREDEERRQQYQQSIAEAAASLETLESLQNTTDETTEENSEEATAEDAEYINEKLKEIARLKAQFKRVQHMINTTELIENHISKHEAAEKTNQEATTKPKPSAKPATAATAAVTTSASLPLPATIQLPTPIELPTMPEMPTIADLEAATTSDEKEQLILTMLNMFQDFSTDLKSQADNLRAERQRIKELKESIIRSRKEPPK